MDANQFIMRVATGREDINDGDGVSVISPISLSSWQICGEYDWKWCGSGLSGDMDLELLYIAA